MATKRLTKREKALIYLLLCLGIFVGGLCLAILPTLTARTDAEESLEALKMQKMEMQIKRDSLPRNQERLKDLQAEYDALYANLLPNTVTSEMLDILVTQTAIGCGISPQSLSILGGGEAQISPFTGDASSGQAAAASEEQADITGLQRISITINGNCGYAAYVKLLDAFAAQGQLVIDNTSYSVNEETPEEGGFTLSLTFYLVPPRGSVEASSSADMGSSAEESY